MGAESIWAGSSRQERVNGASFAGPPEELAAYLRDIECSSSCAHFATEVMPKFTARG